MLYFPWLGVSTLLGTTGSRATVSPFRGRARRVEQLARGHFSFTGGEWVKGIASPLTDWSRQTWWRYLPPVAVYLINRFILLVAAWRAPTLLARLHKNPSFLPATDPLSRLGPFAKPWFRFDARWYVDVAQNGYHYGSIGTTNTNFFPLYPLLIRVVKPVTLGSPWLSAWLVANLAFLGALLLLWRWAQVRWGSERAFLITVLTASFPFAFFYAAPYSESLFFLLATATFLLIDENRWTAASAAASLAALTRPVGLVIVAALILTAALERRFERVIISTAALVPFAAFVAYLGFAFGHPLAFTVYHTPGWVGPKNDLLATIGAQFNTGLSPFDRVDAFLAMLFLASGAYVWRSFGTPYGLFAVAGVLLPLLRGLGGIERYVIVLFPVMAWWSGWRSKVGRLGIFALSLLALILATVMFASGYAIF